MSAVARAVHIVCFRVLRLLLLEVMSVNGAVVDALYQSLLTVARRQTFDRYKN
jgi:hypothetical protein